MTDEQAAEPITEAEKIAFAQKVEAWAQTLTSWERTLLAALVAGALRAGLDDTHGYGDIRATSAGVAEGSLAIGVYEGLTLAPAAAPDLPRTHSTKEDHDDDNRADP